MSRTRSQSSAPGMGMAARFALVMTGFLVVAMVLAGLVLLPKTQEVVDRCVDGALRVAVRAQTEVNQTGADLQPTPGSKMSRAKGVLRFDTKMPKGTFSGREAAVYEFEGDNGVSIVAPAIEESPRKDLTGLIVIVGVLVVLMAGLIAIGVATQTSKPLAMLVDDVHALGRRGLRHSVRESGPKEVFLLARAIKNMASELDFAQDAQLELSVREREQEVGREVSAALRPASTPTAEGWSFTEECIEGTEIAGSFHTYIEEQDRILTVLCDTGDGVPGALVGATARAFIRSALQEKAGLTDALASANLELHRDIRRGLSVTAVVVDLQPSTGSFKIICAGHRIAPLYWNEETSKLSRLQPEGIALGFDAGPVFEQRLEVREGVLAAGSALILASSGLFEQPNEEGEEWGEEAFQKTVNAHVRRGIQNAAQGVIETCLNRAGDPESEASGDPIPSATLLVIAKEK